jgi:hypothetical protein
VCVSVIPHGEQNEAIACTSRCVLAMPVAAEGSEVPVRPPRSLAVNGLDTVLTTGLSALGVKLKKNGSMDGETA